MTFLSIQTYRKLFHSFVNMIQISMRVSIFCFQTSEGFGNLSLKSLNKLNTEPNFGFLHRLRYRHTASTTKVAEERELHNETGDRWNHELWLVNPSPSTNPSICCTYLFTQHSSLQLLRVMEAVCSSEISKTQPTSTPIAQMQDTEGEVKVRDRCNTRVT